MILAIDSATKKASVALMLDNKNIVTKSIDNEITHSEKLLPLIDELLKENNVKLNDIESLACNLGPGSFTGVRIGIATVKALAKVLNINVLGATSLNLLAVEGLKQNTSHKYLLSTMDAKNNRVYYELFEIIRDSKSDFTLKETRIKGNLPCVALISVLKDRNIDDVLVVSDNKEALLNSFIDDFKTISVVQCELKIENIFKNISSYPIYNYNNLDAMYYRSSEAERTKNGEI